MRPSDWPRRCIAEVMTRNVWLLPLACFGLALGTRAAVARARHVELTGIGANVVMTARDEEELERARRDIERAGRNVTTLICDVTQHDQVQTVVRRVNEQFGAIDALINNAGAVVVGPIEAATTEDFEQRCNSCSGHAAPDLRSITSHARAAPATSSTSRR